MHAPVAKLTPTFAEQFAANPNVMVQTSPPQFIPLPSPAPQEPKPLKVALIGTAPSSRMLAPFGDQSWDIWACSPGNMNALPRVSVWFELHGNMFWPECQSYGVPYVKWLKEQTFPLYMQNQAFVERAMTFPMVQMVREFGQDFFTSSFAWMMALAISQKASEIALFGIDMASRDEYIIQRQGFYYFRQVALQRGIKVWAPRESDIMQSPGLYGYSEVEGYGRKVLARKTELDSRIAPMEAEKNRLEHNIAYLKGAQEDSEYFGTIQIGITNEIILQAAEIADLKGEIGSLKTKLVEHETKANTDVADLTAKLAEREAKANAVIADLNVKLAECEKQKARRKQKTE